MLGSSQGRDRLTRQLRRRVGAAGARQLIDQPLGVGPDGSGLDTDGLSIDELARITDTHVGTVDEVAASLAADLTLAAVSDVSFQVHSIAATHELTLRSLQLLADEVAPRLGFATGPDAAADLHHAHRALVTASPEGLS